MKEKCLFVQPLFILTLCVIASDVWAQQASTGGEPMTVVTDYSTQMLTILKGPIAKILSAVVLLGGVGGLLRGRHKLAVSCAVGFVVLLFLQTL